MEEGEGQEGKVQELLEASDIKKIIIELSKSKKRHFFMIFLFLEFYLKLFLLWRTERICSTFKIIVSHFYILQVLCSYHWQYKLSIYRVSSTVDEIIFLSLSDAQVCTNIPPAFGKISFPKKKRCVNKSNIILKLCRKEALMER